MSLNIISRLRPPYSDINLSESGGGYDEEMFRTSKPSVEVAPTTLATYLADGDSSDDNYLFQLQIQVRFLVAEP